MTPGFKQHIENVIKLLIRYPSIWFNRSPKLAIVRLEVLLAVELAKEAEGAINHIENFLTEDLQKEEERLNDT